MAILLYNPTIIMTNIGILILILFGINLILIGWVIRLEIKIKKLLSGKNARSLEDTILHIKNGVESLDTLYKKTKEHLGGLEQKIKKNIKKVQTIRFNPFKGTGDGGNQSFATALLNEEGDGVVISSLYSRERVSVFAKPIKNYTSEYEMSEEEKEVVNNAKLS